MVISCADSLDSIPWSSRIDAGPGRPSSEAMIRVFESAPGGCSFFFRIVGRGAFVERYSRNEVPASQLPKAHGKLGVDAPRTCFWCPGGALCIIGHDHSHIAQAQVELRLLIDWEGATHGPRNV